jgi:hypothetical protein
MGYQNMKNKTLNNSFAGFMEWDMFKLTYMVFQIVLTFVAPLILYSIVWYERYGSDFKYSTLTNRILSHICLISIGRCFIARIPYGAIIFYGPFSTNTCDVIILVARYSFLCTFIEIAIWQLVKYFYIFKWKYLVRLNDDISAICLTTCNLPLSAVFIFVTYMNGSHSTEVDYQICTGKRPNITIITSFRYNLKQENWSQHPKKQKAKL